MGAADAGPLKERSGTGWLFSLVGGALTALFGAFVINTGFGKLLPLSGATDAGQTLVNEGMIIVAAGLLVLFGSVAFYAMPDQRRNWAGLVVALSILGWIESAAFVVSWNVGELYLAISIGPILGLLGGILGVLGTPASGDAGWVRPM